MDREFYILIFSKMRLNDYGLPCLKSTLGFCFIEMILNNENLVSALVIVCCFKNNKPKQRHK